MLFFWTERHLWNGYTARRNLAYCCRKRTQSLGHHGFIQTYQGTSGKSGKHSISLRLWEKEREMRKRAYIFSLYIEKRSVDLNNARELNVVQFLLLPLISSTIIHRFTVSFKVLLIFSAERCPNPIVFKASKLSPFKRLMGHNLPVIFSLKIVLENII